MTADQYDIAKCPRIKKEDGERHGERNSADGGEQKKTGSNLRLRISEAWLPGRLEQKSLLIKEGEVFAGRAG